MESGGGTISTAARATRERDLLRRYHEQKDLAARDELAEHYWDQLKAAGLTMAPLEQA